MPYYMGVPRVGLDITLLTKADNAGNNSAEKNRQ